MNDIELVIKIPKEKYDYIKKQVVEGITNPLKIYIANGILLPKGHGRLKDADKLYNIFKEMCDAYNIDNLSFISDIDMNFDLAPTIIEADTEY